MSLPPRFWSKVDKNGPISIHRPDLGPCHIWTGSKCKDGYGRWTVGSRTDGTRHNALVHVSMFEDDGGVVLPGFELDHLCRVRPCCRRSHLESVSHAVNMKRGVHGMKTHCLRGHLYDEANTMFQHRGNGLFSRSCRMCQRLRVVVKK